MRRSTRATLHSPASSREISSDHSAEVLSLGGQANRRRLDLRLIENESDRGRGDLLHIRLDVSLGPARLDGQVQKSSHHEQRKAEGSHRCLPPEEQEDARGTSRPVSPARAHRTASTSRKMIGIPGRRGTGKSPKVSAAGWSSAGKRSLRPKSVPGSIGDRQRGEIVPAARIGGDELSVHNRHLRRPSGSTIAINEYRTDGTPDSRRPAAGNGGGERDGEGVRPHGAARSHPEDSSLSSRHFRRRLRRFAPRRESGQIRRTGRRPCRSRHSSFPRLLAAPRRPSDRIPVLPLRPGPRPPRSEALALRNDRRPRSVTGDPPQKITAIPARGSAVRWERGRASGSRNGSKWKKRASRRSRAFATRT